MGTAIGIGVGIPFSSQFSWASHWANSGLFLFFASDDTNILNKVVSTQLPNQVTGATDYLTVTGSGLNARYRTPNNATYRAADSDYVFWKTDASESTCDGNRLIGYDFPRILVKYLNVAPYTILWIGILKPGVTVTNQMRDTFDLSIWWDNTLSAHGVLKGNRGIGQSVWPPEDVAPAIPTGLTLTLISGGVKYDWTDTNSGTAQTEIWCRNDSDAYTTATYTIAAGIVTKSETVNPVDLRYCKIRSLKGGNYSAFTSEVNIAMLGAEIIVNGDFTVATGWTANFGFSIGSGKANFDRDIDNASYLLRYDAVVTINKKYRIMFDISGRTIALQLYGFATSGGLPPTFPAPFDNHNDFTNGTHTYYLTCVLSTSTYLTMIGYGGVNLGGSFSIDNLSIKEILVP